MKAAASTSVRRSYQLSLDQDLAVAVDQYHRSLGTGGSAQDTIRELLRAALASLPEEGIIYSARLTAFNKVLDECRSEVARALKELSERFSITAKG